MEPTNPPNPNRINPIQPANGEYPKVMMKEDVVTVPVWVKLLIAASVPMLGGLATMLTPPWSIVATLAVLGVGGVASWLGMTVGTPRK